jgi:uncharacterized protein YjbJ (UPF0337 family)
MLASAHFRFGLPISLLPGLASRSLCAPAYRLAEPPCLISRHGCRIAVPASVHHQSNLQEKTMNKDQTKGRIEEAKGKVKEVTGNLVGNDELELKGKIQKSGGKVQAAYGDLKEDIKDASKEK